MLIVDGCVYREGIKVANIILCVGKFLKIVCVCRAGWKIVVCVGRVEGGEYSCMCWEAGKFSKLVCV